MSLFCCGPLSLPPCFLHVSCFMSISPPHSSFPFVSYTHTHAPPHTAKANESLPSVLFAVPVFGQDTKSSDGLEGVNKTMQS